MRLCAGKSAPPRSSPPNGMPAGKAQNGKSNRPDKIAQSTEKAPAGYPAGAERCKTDHSMTKIVTLFLFREYSSTLSWIAASLSAGTILCLQP